MTQDPLAELRARFLDRCREDLAMLRATADAKAVKAVVHRLAGAAGVFGYGDVSTLAARVDEQLHDGGSADPADLAAVVDALDRIVA